MVCDSRRVCCTRVLHMDASRPKAHNTWICLKNRETQGHIFRKMKKKKYIYMNRTITERIPSKTREKVTRDDTGSYVFGHRVVTATGWERPHSPQASTAGRARSGHVKAELLRKIRLVRQKMSSERILIG